MVIRGRIWRKRQPIEKRNDLQVDVCDLSGKRFTTVRVNLRVSTSKLFHIIVAAVKLPLNRRYTFLEEDDTQIDISEDLDLMNTHIPETKTIRMVQAPMPCCVTRNLEGVNIWNLEPDDIQETGQAQLLWHLPCKSTLMSIGMTVVSPCCRMVAATSGKKIYIASLWNGKHIYKNDFTFEVMSVVWSDDSFLFAVSLMNSNILESVKIYESATGLHILNLGSHFGQVYGMSFNRQSNMFATGCCDLILRLYAIPAVALQYVRDESFKRAFDDSVFPMSVDSQSPLQRIMACHIFFSPNGSYFAAKCHNHMMLSVWDTSMDVSTWSEENVHITVGTVLAEFAEGFSPNSKLLLCLPDFHTVELWSTETGRKLHKVKIECICNGFSSAVFSSDSAWVLLVTQRATIYWWRFLDTGLLCKKNPQNSIYLLSFQERGRVSAHLDPKDDATVLLIFHRRNWPIEIKKVSFKLSVSKWMAAHYQEIVTPMSEILTFTSEPIGLLVD